MHYLFLLLLALLFFIMTSKGGGRIGYRPPPKTPKPKILHRHKNQ